MADYSSPLADSERFELNARHHDTRTALQAVTRDAVLAAAHTALSERGVMHIEDLYTACGEGKSADDVAIVIAEAILVGTLDCDLQFNVSLAGADGVVPTPARRD